MAGWIQTAREALEASTRRRRRLLAATALALPAGLGGGLAAGVDAHASPFPCVLPVQCPTSTQTQPQTTTSTTASTGTQSTAPTASTPAPTAPPAAPGAEYDGHDGTRTYSEIVVAKNGGRLSGFDFLFRRGRCSDGSAYGSAFGRGIPRGGTIGPGELASFSSSDRRAWTFNKAGRRVNGDERVHFSARFSGDRVSGTLTDMFSSRRLRCSSGAVPYVAYRDGSANAPMHDQTVGTGAYTGSVTEQYPAGPGASPRHAFTSSVFLPWRVLTLVQFDWDLFCGGGRMFKQSSVFTFLPIRYRQGVSPSFGTSGHGVTRFPSGVRGYWRYTVDGSLIATATNYAMQGQLQYDISFFRGRALLNDCFQDAYFTGRGPSR
jgi:hypothetical protein